LNFIIKENNLHNMKNKIINNLNSHKYIITHQIIINILSNYYFQIKINVLIYQNNQNNYLNLFQLK